MVASGGWARGLLDLVFIGGDAAALNGSPLVTFDVDITPRRTRVNLARLSAALLELKARVRTADAPDHLPFVHDARSLGDAQTWNLTTSSGDLDIAFVTVRNAGLR